METRINEFVFVRMTGITDDGFNNYKKGQIKVWKDYGEIWGAASYEVLEYVTGFVAAYAKAREYRNG